ncbi:ABC transporter permease [Corynebacterium sp.]|uniref:ABC transporter permease n=1 Tax=Corynebacterium sp. TaxID=1720 RepID=UPI0037351633
MFLALRDIASARGRFALVATVVGLITLLVVMLSGLTGGLGKQNTSALEALGPDRFALAEADGEHTFTASTVTEADLAAWFATAGVEAAIPLGTAQTVMDTTQATTSVAVLGLPAGTALPDGQTVPEAGAVVSEELAEDYAAAPGATVTLAGRDVGVAATTADEYYSHSPVIWVNTDLWREIAHAADDAVGSAIMLTGSLTGEEWEQASAAHGTDALSMTGAFNALPAYQSENSSLLLMQVFLYAISALVTVSFLTVWTIQRTRDLSVLRVLGASPRYLLRDSLGQAVVILIVGASAGAVLGAGLGQLAGAAVPFQLDLSTTLAPAMGIVVLGLIGAFFATRRVTRIDPLAALNAA